MKLKYIKMKIIIITQNEPFYLAKNLRYLLNILPPHSEVVGCVLSDVSPFGKKESFVKKCIKTYKIFGLNFFVYYAIKFLVSKFNIENNIFNILSEFNIPLISLSASINNQNSVRKIKAFNPDLLVSILGNQIFKSPIINLAPYGCLNLHSSLLPKYRGLMPTFWVLKNNEKTTGVSVFYVDEGIDSGPIIVQTKVEIGERTQEELILFTKKLGMEAIAKSIDLIHKNEVKIIPNDKKKKTYYSFPNRQDVIEFQKLGKSFF
jgi:methionyl-tRNA formyltransferase